jgi:alkanesulfonate monooxygenase SsuD/methylene tetrahydromethanopterin reductase-like flavin-dependent oxidoreductase (luciferase family)
MEEGLALVRHLLSGEVTDYDGPLGAFTGVTLSPLPVQQPLEFWLGGMVPAALERCGHHGDGWLPSACTPEEAAAGRTVIEAAAAAAGREISEEHYGVSIAYLRAEPSVEQRAQIAERAKGRDPRLVVPVGLEATRALLEAFIAVGFSKFVLRPMASIADYDEELAALAAAVGELQS